MLTSDQIISLAKQAQEFSSASGDCFDIGVQRTFACMLAGHLSATDRKVGDELLTILGLGYINTTPNVSLPALKQSELNRAAVTGRTVPFLQHGSALQDCIDAVLLAVTLPFGLHYSFQWLGI